jgi:hypothetical protein
VVSDVPLGTGESGPPAVAFGRGRFAAVWTEGGSLRAAIAGDEGMPGIALPAGPGAKDPAIAATAGGGYQVVWREPGSVRSLLLHPDATPAGQVITVAATAGGDPRPAVAASGPDAAVAWADGAGVTEGILAGSAFRDRLVLGGAADPALPVAADGPALIFVLGSKIGLVRPARSGVEPSFFQDGGKPVAPRAIPAAQGFYVAWEDDSGGNDHETVLLVRAGGGKPCSPVTVPSEAGSANAPDVADLGGRAAVAYYQYRDGPSFVYLSIFGPDLQREGAELTISGKHARFPRVAAGDGKLAVAYARAGGPARMAILSCR